MPILMTTKNIKFITLSIQVAIGKYNLKEVCYSHELSGISGTAPSTTASPSPPSPCVMSSTGTGGNTVQNMTHHTVTIKYGYDSSSAAGTLEDDATYSFKDIYVKNTGTGTSDRLAGPITGATNPADPERVMSVTVNPTPTSLVVMWTPLTNTQWNAAGTREYVVSCPRSSPLASAIATVQATDSNGDLIPTSLTAEVDGLTHATKYTCTLTARASYTTPTRSFLSTETVVDTTTQTPPPTPSLTTAGGNKLINLTITVNTGDYNLGKVCYTPVLSKISGILQASSSHELCVMSTRMNTATKGMAHTVTISHGQSGTAGTLEEDAEYSFSNINVQNTLAMPVKSPKWPGPITGTTKPAPPEVKPGMVSEVSKDTNQTHIHITWENSTTVTELNGRFLNFVVQHKLTADTPYMKNNVNATDYWITGLTFGKTYNIRVAYRSSGGIGGYTEINVDTSPAEIPIAQAMPQIIYSAGSQTITACFLKTQHPHPTATEISWTNPQLTGLTTSKSLGTGNSTCLTATLTLSGMLREASGDYTVTASTAGGSATTTITVSVLSPPIITYPEDNSIIHVKEGTNFSIDCDANGNPAPALEILDANGTELKNLPVGTVINDLKKVTLRHTFQNINRNKSAVYTCTAENNQVISSLDTSVEVDVQYPPENCSFASSRQLVYIPLHNQSIQISCECGAHPVPSYHHSIEKLYGPLPQRNVTNRVTMAKYQYSIDVNPVSAGKYQCRVSNNASTTAEEYFSNFTLEIFAAPHMSFSNNSVAEGNNITVNCTVLGFPAPRGIIWRFPNRTIVPDNYKTNASIVEEVKLNETLGLYKAVTSLTITDASASDNLAYTCEAHNGITTRNRDIVFHGHSDSTATATVSIDVHGDTSLRMDLPRALSYHVMEEVVVKCTVAGNPLPTIKWFSTASTFNNKTQTVQNGNITKDRNETAKVAYSVLHIHNVSLADAGLYWCSHANTVHRNESSQLNLTVFSSPSNTHISPTITVNESANVVIECEYDGYPQPAITWHTPSEELQNSSDVNFAAGAPVTLASGMISVRSNLSLSNVSRSNLLNYTCVAHNGIGNRLATDYTGPLVSSTYSSSAIVSLNVLFPATLELDLQETIQLDNMQNYSVTCSASGNPLPQLVWNTTAPMFRTNLTGHLRTRTVGQIVTGLLDIRSANGTFHNGQYACTFENLFKIVSTKWGNLTVNEIDECLSKPCKNGGTCTQGIASYMCSCAAGYTDRNCNVLTRDYDECLSNPCKNNATCVDGIFKFTCRCPAGFTGATCQSLLDCPAFKTRDHTGIFCKDCTCYQQGSQSCDMSNGTCYCNNLISGDKCDTCAKGYYQSRGRLDSCASCGCTANRTMNSTICDANTGSCLCLPQYTGDKCQFCSRGYYKNSTSRDCAACACSTGGSVGTSCHVFTGQCTCRPGFVGRDCSQCAAGHFQADSSHMACVDLKSSTICQACHCSKDGANGTSCAAGTGKCQCNEGYIGDKCDICANPDQFHVSNGGCQDISKEMYLPNTTTIEGEQTISLNSSFVFGSTFKTYRSMKVSLEGWIAFDTGFSGGYNINSRISDHFSIVAPFWTHQNATVNCHNGTKLQVHVVSSTSDPYTFQMIKKEVAPFADNFNPTEAVVVTWREIRESTTHTERNTFQAVVVSDECQSFAIFKYPTGGIGWHGFPYPVVAAGETLKASGSRSLVVKNSIHNLTNGCHQQLRESQYCRTNVKNVTGNSTYLAALVQCPATLEIVQVFNVFSLSAKGTTDDMKCYKSKPVTLDGLHLFSRCCYADSSGQLIETGSGKPYQGISPTDQNLLTRCQNAGIPSYFYSRRLQPQAMVKRVAVQQSNCFGDPHLIRLDGTAYEFHNVGEYVLGNASKANYYLAVVARMEIFPIPNALSFTSITRVGITIGQGSNNTTIEAFAKTGSKGITVLGDLTDAQITAGRHSNFEFRNGGLVASVGGFSANITVQTSKILLVAMQLPQAANFVGLLKSEPMPSNEFQITAATSPFQYAGAEESYTALNPDKQATVGKVNTFLATGAINTTCGGDSSCVADFLASNNASIAMSTLEAEKSLKESSTRVSRVPPLLTVKSSWPKDAALRNTLQGIFGQNSSIAIEVNVSESAKLESFVVKTAINLTVESELSGNVLNISWTPPARRLSGLQLTVSANDSNGQSVEKTIPITLCGCHGTCETPPSTPVDAFKQLTCTSCDAGRTGQHCEDDLDECRTEPCGKHIVCEDKKLPMSGHTCTTRCISGFRLEAGNCLDINECTEKRNHFKQYCIADSTTCSNILGSYLCPCKTGFTGAGNQSCTDINECASSGMNDCDDPNALCTNTRGSYMCSCKRGFNGTGRTAENGCFDINACSNNVHNCIAVSTCSDLDNGKHTCTCPDKQLQTRDGTCDVEPTFSKTLTSHAVTVGDTATFVCGFIGLIRGGATWLDNKGVVIKHSELYKLTTKSSADDDAADMSLSELEDTGSGSSSKITTTTTLQFEVTSRDQAGTYTCRGGNSRKTVSQAYKLAVNPVPSTGIGNGTLIYILAGICGGFVFLVVVGGIIIICKRQKLAEDYKMRSEDAGASGVEMKAASSKGTSFQPSVTSSAI
ncbi:uncharacterized protein LOC135828877 [Sycon ciliatum]|uniref:uncharacterized protein LOC135828877 n=1 Tax=Sycon ciliatum TaxID=27933 RepID=UPI0031F70BDD